jgi:hypothetical protein
MKSTRIGARRRLASVLAGITLLASFGVIAVQASPSSFLELDGNVIKSGIGTYDWANSGALTTTGGTYSRAGSGGIFDGGHFNGNTTPPTAPTRTATAAADATIADAEFKVDPLSVDVTSCGTGDPTAYTGAGSETNGDILSTDTFGTASVPNKDDLSNVYAVAHLSGATNEVFFGAERVINNGDSHIDFEFLQSSVTIPNACSGSFTGGRTEGDFLLAVDFTTGGTLGGTTLYQWHCNADPTPTTSGPQPADGTPCNPVKKSPAHYQQVGTSAVVIKVNDASIGTIGCGGWVCRNPDGTPTQTIAQNELMEGGIDLHQLGFTGCVSTFLPHTRSSQSFTAVLKDFEIIPFNTCVTPSITTQLKLSDGSNASGDIPVGTAIHDTATLHGATADAGGTVTYKVFDNNSCTTNANTVNAGTKTVTNASVPDSDPITFNTAGNFWWQATYSGDIALGGRNIGPTSSLCTSEPVTIVQYHPSVTTTIKNASNVTVTTPQTIPVTLHDTATITNASPNAGGTITYSLFNNSTCSIANNGLVADLTPTPLGTANKVVNGVAPDSLPYTFNTAGTFYFYAVYSGDSFNVGPVNSACSSEPVVISPNTPAVTTTIKNASNVTVTTPQTIPVTLHDTATITGATADAGGTITYSLFNNSTCATANNGLVADLTPTPLGTANKVVNHVAPDSLPYTFNNAGTFYFYAVYSGDGNNAGPVNSVCSSEPVVISPNTPAVTTTVKNASNVAVTTAQTIPVTLHDTASITGATTDAGGTITYSLFNNSTCSTLSNGLVANLTPAVNTVVNGVAPDSLPYTFNNAGTFYFFAVYSGDGNNTGPVDSGCSSEPVVISPNTPHPHSTPVTEIKDTLTVTGLTSDASGTVVVGLYSTSNCTVASRIGTEAMFPVSGAVGGTLTAATSFVVVTSGTYYYKISYAGDNNNTGFNDCGTESVLVTITSIP